jgi:hypothetical protein
VDVVGHAADVWGYGTSRLMSPETGRRTGHRSRSRRVREEVDLGQIHVPAQGFDIVDEMVAPVGGGVLRWCGVAGPLSQGVWGAVFGQAAKDHSEEF